MVFSWVYLPTLSRYRDLKLQQDELDTQIEKLTQDVQDMREERDLLKNDVEYLEKVIRDELGLVKPGEIVYKFVKEEPKAEESPEPVPSPSASPSPSVSPSPSPSGETFVAKPVVAKKAVPMKAAVKPKAAVPAVKKKAVVPIKKKTVTAAAKEPSYPRRETR